MSQVSDSSSSTRSSISGQRKSRTPLEWLAHLLQRFALGDLVKPPKWGLLIFFNKESQILDGKEFEKRVHTLLAGKSKKLRKAFSDAFHPLLGQLRGLLKLKGKRLPELWATYWKKEEETIRKWVTRLRLPEVHAGVFHAGEWFDSAQLEAGTKVVSNEFVYLPKEKEPHYEESVDSSEDGSVSEVSDVPSEEVEIKDPATEESSQLSIYSDVDSEDPENWPKRKTDRSGKTDNPLLVEGLTYYIPEAGEGAGAPLGMRCLRRNGPRDALPRTFKVSAVLSPLEQALCVQHFPAMHLRFTGKGATKHPYCRAIRELAHMRVYTLLEEAERDVVEVGSEFLRIYPQFPTVWHLMPELDPADRQRWKKVERAARQLHWNMDELPVCRHKLEECLCLDDINPTTFIMVDTIYYIHPDTLVEALRKRPGARILSVHHEFPSANAQKWADYRYERQGNGDVCCWVNGSNDNLPIIHSACDWMLPRQYVTLSGHVLTMKEQFRIAELNYVCLEITLTDSYDPNRDAKLITRFWDREHYGTCDDPRFVTAVDHIFSNPDFQSLVVDTNWAGSWANCAARWLRSGPDDGTPLSRLYSAGADFIVTLGGAGAPARFSSSGTYALQRYVIPKTVLAEAKRLAAGRVRDAKVWGELVNTVRRGLLTLKRTPEDVAKLVVPIAVLAFVDVVEDTAALKHLEMRDSDLREHNARLKFDFSAPPPASYFSRLLGLLKGPTARNVYLVAAAALLGALMFKYGGSMVWQRFEAWRSPSGGAMLSSYVRHTHRPPREDGPEFPVHYLPMDRDLSGRPSWFERAISRVGAFVNWDAPRRGGLPALPRGALRRPDYAARQVLDYADPQSPSPPFVQTRMPPIHGVRTEDGHPMYSGYPIGSFPVRIDNTDVARLVVNRPLRMGPRRGGANFIGSIFPGGPTWESAARGVILGPFLEEVFRRLPLVLPSVIGVPLSAIFSATLPFIEYSSVVNALATAVVKRDGLVSVEMQRKIMKQALGLYSGPLMIHVVCSILPFKWALLVHMLWNLHVALKELSGVSFTPAESLAPAAANLLSYLRLPSWWKTAATFLPLIMALGAIIWWKVGQAVPIQATSGALVTAYGEATVPTYCISRTTLSPAIPKYPLYEGPFLKEGTTTFYKISPSAPLCQEKTGAWLMGIGLLHYPPTVMQQCIDNLAAGAASRSLCPTPPVYVDEYESLCEYAEAEIPHQLGLLVTEPNDEKLAPQHLDMRHEDLAGPTELVIPQFPQTKLTWPQIREMSVEEYAADFEPGRRQQLYEAFRSFGTTVLTLKDSEVDGMVKIDEKLTGVQLACWLSWLYLSGQVAWEVYDEGSGEIHCIIPNILLEMTKNPRLISANGSCRWHLATGVWIKPMEHRFLNRTRKLLHKANGSLAVLTELVAGELRAGRNAFITKGLNPNDKGLLRDAIIAAIEDATGEPVEEITMDGKSYDAHHKAHFRAWCCAVLLKMGVDRKIVDLILEEMEQFTIRNVKGFYAKGPGVMGSGKTYTAIFHCIINALTALYAFSRAQGEIPDPSEVFEEDVGVPAGLTEEARKLLRRKVGYEYVIKRWRKGYYDIPDFVPGGRKIHVDRATLVDGDDNELFSTRSKIRIAYQGTVFGKVLLELGLTMKINHFRDPMFADYCSGFYWPADAGPDGKRVSCHIHGPIIGRALTKMGWAIDRYPERLRLRWLGTVYHPLMADYKHIPVLRAVVARTYLDADITRTIRIRGHEAHKVHVSCAGVVNEETWRFMQGRYNLSREIIEDLEDMIYRLKSLPVLISHPVLDSIMRRDYPEIAGL